LFRIILWKLGFEWCHLKRLLSPQSDRKILYFAFGANLSPEVLRQRHIRVFEQFNFVLDNTVLNFSQPGFYKQHGYASADAAEHQVVYGIMYLILKRDAERMDYFEGVPVLRAHEKIFRQIEGKQFYFYRAARAAEGLKPTREYLNYICDAYQQMDCVPNDYLESLKKTEVLDYFEVPNEIGEFVTDIEFWPRFMFPMLEFYEKLCLRTVEFIWNPSLVQWMIKR